MKVTAYVLYMYSSAWEEKQIRDVHHDIHDPVYVCMCIEIMPFNPIAPEVECAPLPGCARLVWRISSLNGELYIYRNQNARYPRFS